jgi:HEPN domain-containing protein
MADRDLAQCRTPNLSPDWQLNIAYNAALQAATAALAAAGYRTAMEAHHYRVIQSLAFTIKVEPRLIAQLDKFRKKRNIGSYEQAGAVSEQEAKEMFALAKNLRDEVEKWLHSNHPELL